MQLSVPQRVTLRAAVAAEPSLASALSSGDDAAIAAWLNASPASAFIVWKSSVPMEDMLESVAWTEVDALTVGKARIFDWMTRLPAFPAGKLKFRQGLVDAFGASSATYTALLALIKRPATRAEAFLAAGTGSDAAPGRLRAEGEVTAADASLIRTS